MMISYQYRYLLPGTRVPGAPCTWYRYQVVDIASANTQENVACVSSVAGMGLRNLANRAILTDVSITNQNMNNAAGPYNGTFCTADFKPKHFSTRLPSNDEVLANSDSDSDFLETVKKADFVEFLDNSSSTSSGSEGDFNT